MCSNSTETIDDLALAVERTIAQNEAALAQYDEEYTSLSEYESPRDPNTDSTDLKEVSLFG